MAEPEIKIDTFVAPEKPASKYAPVVEQLIAAGPDKAATATFDTVDAAMAFLRDMQSAARSAGKSAMKRALTEDKNGKATISVSIRDKITRNRKAGE